MIFLFRSYSKRVANGITLLWILLIIIGIGSIYFHATLSLVGQLVDEISILWVITAGYALFLPSIYLPQSFRVQRHRFVYSCALFALVITCFSFVYPYANAFALMILGLPSIGFIVRHLLRCDSPRIKSLGLHCFCMWAIAVIIWICDRMFCSFWLSISFPYLHSIWHVLILFSSNEAIVICGYLTIKYHNSQANLHLHLWPNEQWSWLTLPYLKFHDDDNEDSLSSKSMI
jgi:alkaline ceramidase